MNHVCDVRPEDLGPYALGQLDAAAEERVRAGVEGCPTCQEQLRELAPVVAALKAGAVPAADPESLPRPPVAALGTVLERVRHRRRRRLVRRGALAVATLLVAVALVVGPRLLADPAATVALTGAGGASGRAQLDDRSWGTSLEVRVTGLDPEAVYGVWLADDAGRRAGAGSFRPGRDGTAQVTLSAGLRLSDTATLGISKLPQGPGDEVVDVLEAPLQGTTVEGAGPGPAAPA